MSKDDYVRYFNELINSKIKLLLSNNKESFLLYFSKEEKDRLSGILNKDKFSLDDINDLLIDYSSHDFDDGELFAILYKYLGKKLYWRGEGPIHKDLVLKQRFSSTPDEIPEFLILPIISYLFSSNSRYKKMAEKLIEDNLPCLYRSFSEDYRYRVSIDFLKAIEKFYTITTDENYVITREDVETLRSFYEYVCDFRELDDSDIKRALKGIINVNASKLGYSQELEYNSFEQNMKVFMSFFGVNPTKCNNDYLYAKKAFDSISLKKYSDEELKQIKLLLSLPSSRSFYIIPSLERNYRSSEKYQFDDILSFIKKYEKTGFYINSKDMSSLLFDKLYLPNYDGADIDSDKRKVLDKYNSYLKKQFIFNFEDLCSYINNSSDLDVDFSKYKYDQSNNFDFSMFLMFCESKKYSDLAGYFSPLLQTKSGKNLLSYDIGCSKKFIKHKEDVYSLETYQKYYPYMEKLASFDDYNLDYFLLDFVDRDDYEKARALCEWINRDNLVFFANSINREDIDYKNHLRLLKKIGDLLDNGDLCDLAPENIEKTWRRFINPFTLTNKSPMKRSAFFKSCDLACKRRLQALALPEVKNMLNLLADGRNVLSYFDKHKYTDNQAFKLIEIASTLLPDEKDKILELNERLQKEIAIREEFVKVKPQYEKTKIASRLLLLFLNTNANTMKEFYDSTTRELGLSEVTQRDLLNSFIANYPELEIAYQEKRKEIDAKTVERISQINRDRAQERLKDRIDLHGEQAVEIMKKFVDSDEQSISKFCSSFDISMKDFRFYRNLCRHIDEDTSEEVDSKALEIRRKFLSAISRTSTIVAKKMLVCHQNKVPYNLVNHYELFGYSPTFICDLATRLGKEKEAKIISQYMRIHSQIFKRISYQELTNMKNFSKLNSSNLYLDNKGTQFVSYIANDLEEATSQLSERKIPITYGSLFSMLKSIKSDVKTDPDKSLKK